MPPRYSYAKIRGMFFSLGHVLGDRDKRNTLLRLYCHDYPSYAYRLANEYLKSWRNIDYQQRKSRLSYAIFRLNKIRQRVSH